LGRGYLPNFIFQKKGGNLAFYGTSFVYNGTPSEIYGLTISNVDQSGVVANPASGESETIEDYVYRRATPFFYGVRTNSRLEFPITLFSGSEITAVDANLIIDWLFDEPEYKKLVICQADMDNQSANVRFTDAQTLRMGNLIYGISGTCKMDSQYFWEYPKTYVYTFTGNPVSGSMIFYNLSSEKEYLKPVLTLTANSSGGDVTLINLSDDSREFIFTGLVANEVISIDCNLGIVESSLGTPRLSAFNKNFMRFVKGRNILTVSGAISQLDVAVKWARRLGA
jgi:hypothetical protein